MPSHTQQRHHYLAAMGIPLWESKPIKSQDSWEALQPTALHCTACSLHQTRTQVVFGMGNHKAKLMLIGEAPGLYEDQQGEPFVGRAGQLLNAMLQSIHLERTDVYVANILKCRPPNNRDPQAHEMQTCVSFLNRQIALVQPQLLLAVGHIAAHYLLKTEQSLSEYRKKTHCYGNRQIPLVVTYHPEYLLRTPRDKAKAYQDLQRVKKILACA